jgi:hypothetical protein
MLDDEAFLRRKYIGIREAEVMQERRPGRKKRAADDRVGEMRKEDII